MSETSLSKTSLAVAHTPNIDSLFPKGLSGFYQPVIKKGYAVPKTDIVIPYMYFISPDDFQGRAALELIDSGEKLEEDTWVSSFRIRTNHSSGLEMLSETASTGLLKQIKKLGSAKVVPFPFSSHKNMYMIIDDDRFCVENHVNKTNHQLQLSGMTMSQVELHQFKVPNSPLKEQIYFLGWSRGSLRGIFRLIGSGVNEFTHQHYCFEEYKQNMEFLKKTKLQEIIEKFNILIFFIKETDSASHTGNRGLKVKAIETLDWTIGSVLPFLPSDSIIVVLSDHPTDLYAPTAINAPTPYLIANASDSNPNEEIKFCEQTIMERPDCQKPLSMYQLREKIFLLASREKNIKHVNRQ